MGCDPKLPKTKGFFKQYSEKVDALFKKMGKKARTLDEAVSQTLSNGRVKRLFTISETEDMLSGAFSEYHAEVQNIHEKADGIKTFLEGLSEDESQSLVQALNGDVQPATLSKELRPVYERFRKVIDANADELVAAGALDKKNKIKDYVKRYYAAYLERKDFLGGIKQQMFKQRKEMDYETRAAMEMIEDSSFVIPNTLIAQRTQLLKAKMLKELADQFGQDEEQEGYVKISDETAGGGVYRYGALAGKYVREDVAEAIQHARLVKETLGVMEQYWYPVIDHLKVNVTVKNPVTHVYNIGSNVLLSGMNGNIKSLAKVLYWAAKDKKKFNALVKKANKYGLNSMLHDMERFELVGGKKNVNVAKTLLRNLYLSADSKTGSAARRLYDWEDKIFKVAAFHDELAKTPHDERGAFLRASDVYVNYDTPMPAFLRTMDKTGLSPFLHYVYKSTPATMKVMAKHPLRALLVQTAIIGGGLSSLIGEDDDEYKPEWAADKGNLFGAKEWASFGNGWYWNAGRMLPGMKFGGLDLQGGFIGGVIRIIGGETPLGYNIGSKYDTGPEAFGKRAAVMAENYLPPVTFGRYGQRTVMTLAGKPKKDYYEKDMTVGDIFARSVGVRKFNEQKELQRKANAARNEMKNHLKGTKDFRERQKIREKFAKKIAKLRKSAMKRRYFIKSGSGGPGKFADGGSGFAKLK